MFNFIDTMPFSSIVPVAVSTIVVFVNNCVSRCYNF